MNRNFVKKSLKLVIFGLIALSILNITSFFYSKFFVTRHIAWQIEITEIGGVDGRMDNFFLSSDGQIIYRGRTNEFKDKMSAEVLREITTHLNDCDFPNSYSTSLPNLVNATDGIGKTIKLKDGQNSAQLPDVLINPLRQISSILLQRIIQKEINEVKLKAVALPK